MPRGQIIDAVQTAALVVVAIAVVYALTRMELELRRAGGTLRTVIERQQEVLAAIEKIWNRIDAIEIRQGLNGAEEIARFRRMMDALNEASKPGLSRDEPSARPRT